jgi:hypothetical protein
MPRDFFDPSPEQQNVVLIGASTLQKAQRMIAGCEACSDDAELPFENVLDRLTGLTIACSMGFQRAFFLFCFQSFACAVGFQGSVTWTRYQAPGM